MKILICNKEEIINPETGLTIRKGTLFTLMLMSSDKVQLGFYGLEKYVSITIPHDLYTKAFEMIGVCGDE